MSDPKPKNEHPFTDNAVATKFTIIVTCFNKAETIAAAITSATNQGTDVEVIVVDDCSNDNSHAVLADIDADQIIFHKTNKGALGAYLTGMRAARGQYLEMLDGDDQLAPGILAALSQTRWLNNKTCVRLGIGTHKSHTIDAPPLTKIARATTFRPGRLFTLSQSTGGTAYVFPKALFEAAETALAQSWPEITVQDHVLPGVIGLLASSFIKLKTIGYWITIDSETPTLGGRKTLLHHDRLLSDYFIALAAEGPMRQKPMSRFLLRLALYIRMRSAARRYNAEMPFLGQVFQSTRSRAAAVGTLARTILKAEQ